MTKTDHATDSGVQRLVDAALSKFGYRVFYDLDSSAYVGFQYDAGRLRVVPLD